MSDLYSALRALKMRSSGGGGGGFTPTEEQLAAMNSGITSEDVEKIGRIIMNDEEEVLIFIQADTPEAPEGYEEIPEGSLWFPTEVST